MAFLRRYQQGMISMKAMRLVLNEISRMVRHGTIEKIGLNTGIKKYYEESKFKKFFTLVMSFLLFAV